MSRGLVLAVDGGNTKTAAATADRCGRVLGSAIGPPSDIHGRRSVGAALDAIEATARTALERADARAGDVDVAVFSLAGADWPEDFSLLEAELGRRLSLSTAPRVVNDAIGGLRSGTEDGEGIAVICGTFNAVCARRRDGRVFHCGFWPDRVGSFDLGMQTLNAVYRAGLDLGPQTLLCERVLAHFEAADALALMHSFTRREAPRSAFAVTDLAPILLDCAEALDPVACEIVDRAGAILGDQARVSAQRVELPIEGTPLVISGGVFRHPSERLARAVLDRLPGAIAVRPELPPLGGALLLGFDALRQRVASEGLAAQLEDLADA